MAVITVPIDAWVMRLFAWVFALTAMVLSIVAAESCRFLELTTIVTEGSTVNPESVSYYGLFRSLIPATSQCVSQDLFIDSQPAAQPGEEVLELSSSHKVARAFGVAAPFFGAVSAFLCMWPFFKRMSGCVGWTAVSMCFVSMVFQALTFMIFNSDECKDSSTTDAAGVVTKVTAQCKVDEGANHAIAAAVLYLITGIILCRLPASVDGPFVSFGKDDVSGTTGGGPGGAQPPSQPQGHPGTVPSGTEVRRRVNPDGSTTTFVTRSMNPPDAAMPFSAGPMSTSAATPAASHGATTVPQSNISDAVAQEWVNRSGTPTGQQQHPVGI